MKIISYIISIVFLVFLFLKLFEFIDWSWKWVFCPVWGMVLLKVFLSTLGGFLKAIAEKL